MHNFKDKSFSDMLSARVDAVVKASGAKRLMVALSGGADSVSLLHLLSHIDDIHLHVVHCNFHLRGDESNRDADFCRSLCQQLDITLDVVHFDVGEYQRLHKVSLEMACRELRYNYFRNVCTKYELQRIATGHNANDNAETLLLNLMRGGGIDGLSAMSEDTGNILRPLLHTSRDEIIRYLHENDLEWVDDHTNAESEYSRNFLRNEVIPLLQTRWPQALGSINKSIAALQATMKYLQHADASYFDSNSSFLPWRAVEESGDITTLLLRFLRQYNVDLPIIKEMSREIAKTIANNEKISRLSGRRWISRLKADENAGNNGETRKIEIRMERDGIYVVNLPDTNISEYQNRIGHIKLNISSVGNNNEPFQVEKVALTTQAWEQMRNDRSNQTLWLPVDCQVIMRHPQPGDRIKPLGMKGRRLLSDVMNDAKLPRHRREALWVAADSSTEEIIWIEGLKRSRLKLLAPQDSFALRITVVSSCKIRLGG